MNHFYSNLKLMLVALFAFVGIGAWADEVTDVLNQSVTGVTGSSYTAFSNKSATSNAVYAGQCAGSNESIQLRSKNSNSGVVATTSGGTAKKIVVTWNANTVAERVLSVYGSNTAYTAATDLYDAEKQGKLIGELKCSEATDGVSTLVIDDDYEFVGFRSKADALYLTSVAITWEAGAAPAVAKPTFSPNGGTFVGTTSVEISCETEGATIYYSMNGADPVPGSSPQYGRALPITETTTVKAIAVKGDDKSKVASATFTKIPSYENFASMSGLENNTVFGYTGSAFIIAKPNSKYVYVYDGSNFALIFDNGGEKTTAAEVGKYITPGWMGKVSIYNKLFELVPDEAIVVNSDPAQPVNYPEVALGGAQVNQVIKVKNVTSYSLTGKNLKVYIGGEDKDIEEAYGKAGYNQFGIEIAAAEEGKTYEIVGAIGQYNDNLQFWPISIQEEKEPGPEPEIGFYVTGTMAEWGIVEANKMTLNEVLVEKGIKEFSLTMSLVANAEVKVVASYNGTTPAGWFPAGEEDKYHVPQDGEYTVYCRPNFDGDGTWIANCLKVVPVYIKNAGFEESDESNAIGIRTYNKDIKGEEVAQMQPVTGWTIVENGDARAAGVFAYGSESFLGGEGYVAPAPKYAFEEGAAKALGMVAVWGASLQYTQDVNLAPGNYMLQVPVYNAGGTTAVSANKIGANGTFASATQFPVGQWTVLNVEFTVEATKNVTISLGYTAGNSGSGAMPHLFIESAKLYSGDENITLAKAAAEAHCKTLNAAIALDKAKETKLAALNALVPGEGLFQYDAQAINLAKEAVVLAETVEAVEAVAMPTPTQPDAEKQYTFQLKEGGMYMAVNEGIKLADKACPFSFVAVEGGWALKNGDEYVANTGNAWTMSMTADPYAWTVSSLGEGYYTLAKASKTTEYIGVDNTDSGSNCYANKALSDKSTWAIAEYEAPAYTVTISDAIENGTVEATPTEAKAGETVSLTVTPDEGYQLKSIMVTCKTTDEVVVVGEDHVFIMPADDVTVTATFKDLASVVYIKKDLTAQFPLDFEGWKGASGYVGWAAPEVVTNDGRKTPACEKYESTCANTGEVFSRKLTGLANGTYTIEVYGAAAYTPGRGFDSELVEGDETAVYLFAQTSAAGVKMFAPGEGEVNTPGEVKQYIPAHVADNFNGTGLATAILENVEVSDGTVTIGMYKDKPYTNWHVIQIKGVTANVDAAGVLAHSVQEAQAVDPATVPEALATQINETVETYNKEYDTAEEYLTAIDAIDAVVAKAEAYAPLTAVLKQGDVYKAHVAEGDAAIATYEQAIADVTAAYEAAVVADIPAAIAVVEAALPALAKAQTLPGSDMTILIVNPEINGADGWTIDRPFGGNGPLLNGTAFEYWAGNASDRSKASFDYYQVIEGLPNGLYAVSADMYNSTNGEDGAVFAPTSGVYGSAEDEEATLVDVDGTELITYTTESVLVTDGKLRIGVKSTEAPMAARWFVADNFKLTLVKTLDPTELAYEKALANIEDGKSYRVFTEVNESKYYLTPEGYLADNAQKAGTFTFSKVKGAAYEYGFQLLDSYFTNPPTGGNPTLANGHIATDANSKRNDWEAQVFFMNAEGKYAVRATNAAGSDSGWGLNAKTFWTVSDGPKAEYSFDQNYVWQIEENVDTRPAILAEIKPITDTWGRKMQEIGGLVTETSQFSANSIAAESIGLAGLTDGDYGTYFHSQWGNSGVTEPHYLQAELPNAADKFYFYFVKRDPVNNANVNNRPTDIKISGSNDGTNFTEITEISEGLPAAVPPIDYMSGLISANEPYKYIRFTVLDTNNHATDDNGNKFFTFSEFYILPSDELFDAATSLMFADYTDIPLDGTDDLIERVNTINNKLNGFFVELPVNVVFNGEVVKTENVALTVGKAPVAPASFNNGLVELTSDVETVTAETQEVNFTATFKGPFQFSTNFNNAVWYNMDIRSGKYVAMSAEEPYYPAEATAEQLATPEYMWAFTGNPYELVILNYAAGADKSLAKDGSNVVMRDGEYKWELFGNNKENGFVIREKGTESNWVNQNGGASGPLQFWNSANGRNDDGSTFRIHEVPVIPAVAFTVTPNIASGTQAEFTIVETGTALKLAVSVENLEANGYDPKDISLKVGTLFAGRFSDKGFAMGTNEMPPYMKNDIVLPLADEVTLADDVFGTEYPFIQSIRITGLSLVKGEEPIAAIDEMIVISFIEVYENGKPVGIKAIATQGEKAEIYDLSGRKVEKVQRGGVYIINGKKVSVK